MADGKEERRTMIIDKEKSMKLEPIEPNKNVTELLKIVAETNKMIVEKLAIHPVYFMGIDRAKGEKD